jgi:hypothetical protein
MLPADRRSSFDHSVVVSCKGYKFWIPCPSLILQLPPHSSSSLWIFPLAPFDRHLQYLLCCFFWGCRRNCTVHACKISFARSMTWRNTPPARVMQCTCYDFKCLYTTHFEVEIVVSVNGWIVWQGGRYSLAAPAGRLKAVIADSNPAGGTDAYLLWVLCCCQVEISAMGWSLVQRSLTECGVS